MGGLAKDHEIITAGSSNSAIHTEVRGDPENDWPEPAAVKFEWRGKTKDGKGVEARLEGSLGDRLDRVDIMAEVPGFVKKIIGGVAGTKPYIYQVGHTFVLFQDSVSCNLAKLILGLLQYAVPMTLYLKIGEDDEINEQGTLFSEATFIS